MQDNELINAATAVRQTQQWLDHFVIELDLCPFARRERVLETIRFCVSDAATEADLLCDLETELSHLDQHPEVATTLLIHPHVLTQFLDYNQFLNAADDALVRLSHAGVYQVASFHPDYQFAGTKNNDPENFTNRSPYPMLHLLREASVEAALKRYANPDQIPANNIEKLNALGLHAIRARLASLT
ncbi:MAG: DUF1415 domain-containing protein [Pseudomonadota bacterium]